MLTPRDWKSLRFSQSTAAMAAEWLLGAASVFYLYLAVAFFQTAEQIAAIRNTSLAEMIETAWTGVNPLRSYPGTFVMALQPLTLGVVCLAIGIVIAILFALMGSLRRRNQRILIFLDRYQSSFTGTLPEDEDIEHLIETV